MALDQIRGMFVPVPTPFLEDGSLDETVFAQLVRFYVQKGVNAIFLFGSYGQGPAMGVEQRMRGLEVAMEAAGHKVPVVPQVSAVDPFTARELALHAKSQGVEAVALVGPYYYADRTEQELIGFFKMVDDAVGLPMFLYNNPRYQGYSITPKLLGRIRSVIPNLFGIKMAKGSISDILAYRDEMGPDFKLFAPQENLYPGLYVGQTGSVSPPLTLAIDLGLALVNAIERERQDEALRLCLAVLKFSREMPSMARWGRAPQAEGLRYIGFDVKQYPRWPGETLPREVIDAVHLAIDHAQEAVAVRS